MNELLGSKKMKIASFVVGGVIMALLIFASGVAVGVRKARFSEKFAGNYEKMFAPRQGGAMNIMHDIEGRNFRNGHGMVGEIISISDQNIIIKDLDDRENSVTVSDQTIIKSGRDNLKINDLKNGDKIIVIGKPNNNGVVEAALIRIFPNLDK